jgi:hypothetical protein
MHVLHLSNLTAESVQDCIFGLPSPIIASVTSPDGASLASPSTPQRLRHVRWLAGGTGSGKSTAAAVLARRFDLDVYDGDRAEHDWLLRCTAERQPHFSVLRGQQPGDMWRDRSPAQIFEAMGGRHGETVEFLLEDLLARPADRTVLVDYFGVLPHDLAPLLSWPGQAAFLVATPKFCRATLTRRYADPDRARANWGDLDAAEMLEARLARDALWNAEVTRQARELELPLLTIDGSRSVDQTVDALAQQFRLDIPR